MIPEWLDPVRAATESITVDDLTSFRPPRGSTPRRGAVLVLFGDDADNRFLLLTERAHHMRSHPAQVSFPGGSLDPGEEAVAGALREAQEETGLDPAGVELFGMLPELWLPPSNFAVTPVLAWWRDLSEVRVVDPNEVHAVYRVPLTELVDPTHRVMIRHPSGWLGPGFMIGEDKDVVLWGFTAGIVSRLFDYVGWSVPWDRSRVRDLPDHVLAGVRLPGEIPEDEGPA